MEINYAIATFCFGERYYKQTNRLIQSFDYLESKPNIFIITDSENEIDKRDFVFVKNVSAYNAKYLTYQKNYYSFDFSVKRFALQFAFENNFENVILSDTDIVVNENLYSHDRIMECFQTNSIVGQVTYNFNNQIQTNSQLGQRFLYYEKKFGITFPKEMLDFMPEDCVQFISIEKSKQFKFLNTWNECIKIKNRDSLSNAPAGNIDEMCFSALYNDLYVGNNSHIHINLVIPKHDKWY
jgi:hypothetical protein